MRSQLIIATTLFLSGTFAWGQELSKRWSLEECIRYAIEHNIDLKQKEQDQESRRVELHTSKFSWCPIWMPMSDRTSTLDVLLPNQV